MSDNKDNDLSKENEPNEQPVDSKKSEPQVKVVKVELSKKSKAIIFSSIALFSIAIGLLVFLLLRNNNGEDLDEIMIPGGNMVISSDNLDDIKQAITEKVERGMFSTYMNTTWTFPDSKSPSSDAVMGNSPNNNYPFWFSLAIGDDEIYRSSLLPVGTQLKEVILTADLPPGTHNALMDINMVDENGEPVESNMKFAITLIIRN